MKPENNFEQILLQNKILTNKELEELNSTYSNNIMSIIQHLIEEERVQREVVGKLIGDSIGLAYTNLDKILFQENILTAIPEELAKKTHSIPLYKFGDTITVAMASPFNLFTIDKIEKLTKCHVSTVFSFPDEIDAILESYYNPKTEINNEAISIKKKELDAQKINLSEGFKKHLTITVREISGTLNDGKIPKLSKIEEIIDSIVDVVNDNFGNATSLHDVRIDAEFFLAHPINVGLLCACMGKALDYNFKDLKDLTASGVLHDIGLFLLPNKLLNAKNLSKDDKDVIKKHTTLGYELIKKIGFEENIAKVALNHHEGVNGQRYNSQIHNGILSQNTQIVSIIDSYDVLVSDKLNYKTFVPNQAINYLLLCGRFVLNYNLLHKFANLVCKQEFTRLKEDFKNSPFEIIL